MKLTSSILVLVLAVVYKANSKPMKKDTDSDSGETVYVENYDQADTDTVMNSTVVKFGAFGKFFNQNTVTPILPDNSESQVIHQNRDTLYSYGVFDVTEPLTVQLPASNGYYMSLYGLDEEQYALAILYADVDDTVQVTFAYQNTTDSSCETDDDSSSNENFDNSIVYSTTQYIFIIVRTFADPTNLTDLVRANLLQDEIKITQSDIGVFNVTDWDRTSLSEVGTAIANLAAYTETDISYNGFRGEIDPTIQLIGTAAGWGALPLEDAFYQGFIPDDNTDTSLVYYIEVPANSVPIASTAFWSITVYNSTGYLEYNEYDSYSYNSVTAKQESNGSIIIYFSSTKEDYMTNWLYTYSGWTYLVRMYEPEEAILDGEYEFPSLVLAD